MDAAHYQIDAALAETHWWWVARRKLLRRLLDRFVGKNRKRKILEVGCSTGSNLRMLQEFGTVHGLELHKPAVAYCRMRFPGIRIYDGGIPDPLRDVYDAICLFDVLEHIEDEAGALEWIDDHLAPGGVLLVTVPAYDFLWSHHDELAHHHRRYTKTALEALLGQRFEVAYASYFNTHLFPAIAAVRLIQRLLRLDGGSDKAVGGKGFSNGLLQTVFAAERLWLPVLKLPFGVSIFAVAHKSKAPACAA
jgi:SAM-dependent methyltransferase